MISDELSWVAEKYNEYIDHELMFDNGVDHYDFPEFAEDRHGIPRDIAKEWWQNV